MREIKFRAWDKSTKKMFHNLRIWVSGRGGWESEEIGKDGLPQVDDAEDILLQFTGLKDKNGKEIYEGDIVRYEPLSSYGASFGKTKNVVKFINGCFELVPYEDKRWGGYKNLEVIGNIYENPELLKSLKGEDGS